MKGNIKKLEWVQQGEKEAYLEATIEVSAAFPIMVSAEWEDLTLGSVEISQKSFKLVRSIEHLKRSYKWMKR